jgi:hypothetical protein
MSVKSVFNRKSSKVMAKMKSQSAEETKKIWLNNQSKAALAKRNISARGANGEMKGERCGEKRSENGGCKQPLATAHQNGWHSAAASQRNQYRSVVIS